MRIPIATAFFVSLISVLPAAAASCPGTVVLQDAYTAANSALDVHPSDSSSIVIAGGKAETTLLKAGFGRIEEYWGSKFGDANVCVTVEIPASDKAEGQVAGITFWAADYNSYYIFEVNPSNGQFAVYQHVPAGTWTVAAPWTASPAIVQGAGKPNNLRVQTKGVTATVFVNDQQVASITGAPPAGGGQVGFYAEAASNAPGTELWDFTNFAASATQTAATPITSPICPGTVIFQDKFPTPDPLLNIQTAAQAQLTTEGGKGEIILLQGNYTQSAEFSGNQFGDANVCASFNTLATDKAEGQMGGLIFWAADYANGYLFFVNPTTGQYEIAQKAAGNWITTIISTPNANVQKGMGKVNNLRVQTKGNTATFFINGQQVETLIASPPAGGGVVGMYAESESTFSSKQTWQVGNFTVATAQ